MIQGIIFDMDGLIIDSEPVYYDIFNQILGEYGIQLDMKTYTEKISGRSDVENFRYILETYPLNLTMEQLAHKEKTIEMERIRKGVPLKPGVHEILTETKKQNLKTALATSNTESRSKQILNDHHLLEFFDEFVFVDEVEHGKPAPDLFLLAAERLDVPKQNCLVLEDSFSGVKAAYNAGIPVIMVPDLKQPDEILKTMCTDVKSGLPEVMEWIRHENGVL
ncbi:MAG: HAD family hydrolase [Bulleidia sp.]